MIWFIIILVLVLVLALPVILESQRRLITAPDRKAAPGEFAQLSQGLTHYQWIGPSWGPVAVLIHGLTTPSAVWTDVAQDLSETGNRVLAYDL